MLPQASARLSGALYVAAAIHGNTNYVTQLPRAAAGIS